MADIGKGLGGIHNILMHFKYYLLQASFIDINVQL